jgi:hypothetical protein
MVPVVGGWVRVQKRNGVRFIFRDLSFDIELPSPRNAQKRDKQEIEKKSVLDFWRIFGQNVSTRCFFQNVFFSVFNSHR